MIQMSPKWCDRFNSLTPSQQQEVLSLLQQDVGLAMAIVSGLVQIDALALEVRNDGQLTVNFNNLSVCTLVVFEKIRRSHLPDMLIGNPSYDLIQMESEREY